MPDPLRPTAAPSLLAALLFLGPQAAATPAPRQAVLRGRVHDGATPVAGARVVVQSQVDERLRSLFPELLPPVRQWELVADERGRFTLEVPPGSLYRAFATDAAGGRTSLVRHGIRPGDRFGLPLVTGGSLVVEAPRGEPLAYELLGTDRDSRREFSLRRGLVADRAELVLPPGPYRLRLRSAGAAAATCSFHVEPGGEVRLAPALRPPAWLRVAGPATVVRLPEALRFEGRAERPVDGRVPLPCFDLLLEVRLGRDSEERHVLPRFGPGEVLALAAPPQPARTLAFAVKDAGDDASLLLLWRSALGIEKRLLLPGADGFAAQTGLPKQPILALYQDLDGRVAVRQVAAGTEGRVELVPEAGCGVAVRIAAGGAREGLRPRLTAIPAELRDAPDLVGLHPPSLHFPDLRGRLELGGLAPGRWLLLVEADHRVPVLLEVELHGGEERPTREVALELGQRLHGVVRWPDGKPAANVLVKLSHPIVGHDLPPLEAWTDAEGRYGFDGLPEARYLVEARTERAGRTFSVRRTGVPAGPDPVGLDLADEDPVPPDRRR
ncbi:MAG: carboxypeptidase-like regulatory domain-containing protein [Planctomycetota bacterium]